MGSYIDADNTIKAMNTWDKFGVSSNGKIFHFRSYPRRITDNYIPYVKYDDMINCVRNMPSADVRENVYGNWIRVKYYRPSTGSYDIEMGKCSNCSYEYSYDVETGVSYKEYNFCPNCGAKMAKKV